MGIKSFNVKTLSEVRLIDPKDAGYQDSIDIIYDELQKTRKSFIKIGWYLKHINEAAMYTQDGYTNIYEFAHERFNISQSTTTRFINLCTEFSVNHDSPELDEKYLDFSVSQLFEMLPMRQEQKEQVTSDMPIKKIREIKNEAKNEVKEPSADEIRLFYEREMLENIDRKNLKKYMASTYGHCVGGPNPDFCCTHRGIKINLADEITWTRFVNRVNELIPMPEDKEKEALPEDDSVPGQTSIEKDFPECMPDDSPLPGQSDEYATSHKEEIVKQTVIDGEYREIDDIRALRDEIEELSERVRKTFWEWKAAERMPHEEIETAKKDVTKLTIAIEKLLIMN